jgi:hypothetical protein
MIVSMRHTIQTLMLLSSEGIEPIKDGHELVVIVLRAKIDAVYNVGAPSKRYLHVQSQGLVSKQRIAAALRYGSN